MSRLANWLRVALIDLRGTARRFTLLVACLALGVAAIGTVSAVRSSVEAAIARDARMILGGDLELRSQGRDIDPSILTALAERGTVSRETEISAQASANGRSAFLSLRAVTDAYPLVGAVTLSDPAGPADLAALLAPDDGRFGIVLAQQASLRLGISVGDVLRIGNADFILRGIIDTLPDQAAAGFQVGAPALVLREALAPAGLREEGVLSQFRYKVLLADGDIEAARAALETQFPDADVQIRSPEQATATIARFIGVFGNFMLLVALSSMVVGGLGAANAVSAYIGERQGAIATMRSLGAKGPRILFHFLVQIALLSLLAVAIGLIVVAIATLALLPLLSGLIDIDLPARLDASSMLVSGAIGFVTAMLFSWVPLLQARSIRPALLFRSGTSAALSGLPWRRVLAPATALPLLAGFAALFGLTLLVADDMRLVAIYFVSAILAFGLLRAAAATLRWALTLMPTPSNRLLRQAISAILRPGAPTTTVLVSMGMGLSLLLLIVTTQSNINRQIATEVSADIPDFVMLDMDRTQRDALEAFAAARPEVDSIATIPMLRGTVTEVKGAPAPSSDAVPRDIAEVFRGDTTLTWSAALPANAVIDEGEWWPQDYSGQPLVSLSADLRNALDLTPGDTVTISISGRPLTMTIANFRRVDPRSPDFNFRIIASPGLIESAPQTYFATVKASKDQAPRVEAGLIAALPDLRFVPVGEALARVQTVFDALTNAIALVSGTAVIAGILVLSGALSVGRQQREADAVVMKVLGARRSYVISAFLIEYALLGAIAALIAGGLALAGSWAAATFLLDIGFSPAPLQLVLLAIAIVVVTTATGAATTWSAMSTRPADRLREEG
ncbi:ABC transporter permease [Devosia chinhatensis]|uniref:ABC3 transporter permease C-terminal domain-containing protein n=1 Tax=Devosia chinhatensis TaxID=429727 RepID=A0A0F5FL93_9HYPH|nr:FtsX-like permease family protein [Devosia chinhatensis]KKB09654.1 hypothetical protein VE26_07210 [Devosia chinhatensis]